MSRKDEEVRIETHWRMTEGPVPPAFRRLWARLLREKGKPPAEQAHGEDTLTGGIEKDSPQKSE